MKTCTRCKEAKPLDAFNKNRTMSDGLSQWCRSCRKAHRNQPAQREAMLAKCRDPEYLAEQGVRRRKRWRQADSKEQQRYQSPEYKQMRRARQAVRRAIIRGDLIRPDACPQCGRTEHSDSHHFNGYDEEHWLDVVFLCRRCHRKADKERCKV